MRQLPDLPVFTLADALAGGATRSAIAHALRTGRLHRIRHGVYTSAREVTPELIALAAGRSYSGGVVSHRSAALLHGLPVIGGQPWTADVTVRPRGPANLQGVHLYRATLREHDVTAVGGVAVTSVARTLCDVARHRAVATSVAAIDAALYRGLVTEEEVHDVLRFCWNWPRIRRAQRAVRLSDARAESPLESASRLTIAWIGLPAPEPQKLIFDQFGRLVGRADFYWDEFGVVGEADGRMKYRDDDSALRREKDRQEELENLHLVVARWGWELATVRRHALGLRLERAFERGRLRDRSGFPRLWTL